ncbi:MAG: bifunctional phosphoribosyl-AMP cyclohydrolase/phosphoribosyl-ATP diphosphatase HisIE [Cytophagales bacterium]|nr:MAG: bifunctional phosphoribosyl-AMP cyclohydrolase/phosphoribosyl-ATP diphosphatase HisIE [Cytophagales bacterium]
MNSVSPLDFHKNPEGLIPAIIQDENTQKVLMLGFMNEEAYQKTVAEKKVTFYSRTRQRLWTKGETSGNFLWVKQIIVDCDQDTLLIKVRPEGVVCHTGADTCFDEKNTFEAPFSFLSALEKLIKQRFEEGDEKSYTYQLHQKGINKIAQKVGEEATETIIEATNGSIERLKEESADLLFHWLVLLQYKNISLADIITVLEKRHRPQS